MQKELTSKIKLKAAVKIKGALYINNPELIFNVH